MYAIRSYYDAGSDYLFQEEFKAPVLIHESELQDLAKNSEVTVSRLFGVSYNFV